MILYGSSFSPFARKTLVFIGEKKLADYRAGLRARPAFQVKDQRQAA